MLVCVVFLFQNWEMLTKLVSQVCFFLIFANWFEVSYLSKIMKLFKPEVSQNSHANYDLFILKREYHNTTSWLHYWFSIIFFYWMKTWDWPFKIWWLINFLGSRIGKRIFLDFGLKKKWKKKAFELWRGSLVCFFIEIHHSQLRNSFKHLLEFFLIKEKNIYFV